MFIYKFYQITRSAGRKEKRDITGENFKILMQKCFKYSKYLSLNYICQSSPMMKHLEKFVSLAAPPALSFAGHCGCAGKQIYYDICDELYEIIVNSANGLFENWVPDWQYFGPENPVFYREDGTVFMDAFTHNGEITLRPNAEEDVSDVISNEYWLAHENDYHVRKSEFCMCCVPDEKSATSIAKIVFKNTQIPRKRELKWAETTFDQQTNKWNIIFARKDYSGYICRIIVDRESARTEVFYESI